MSLDQKIRQLNHRRIDFFRAIKLHLTYLFCRVVQTDFVRSQPQPPHFLVLRLDDKLGDSITSTGFLKCLKNSDASAKVTVVAGPQTVELYKRLNFVDQVFESRKGVVNTLQLLKKLKKEENFSALINTSHILNPRTLFLTAALKSVRKISFGNSRIHIFSDFINIDFLKEHVTGRYKKVLDLLGIRFQDGDLKYRVQIADQAKADVKPALEHFKTNGIKLVALNLFAGGKLRNLNREKAHELIHLLVVESNLKVVFLANEGDHRILKQWGLAQLEGVLALNHLCTLQHNIALAESSDIIVTPDTAWVHIASALDKKLVAIYRDDRDSAEANSVIWAPYLTPFRIVYSQSNLAKPHDINDVNLNDVKKAVEQILDI